MLPFFRLFGSVWGMNPMMRYINLFKIYPWFGLFKKSLFILSVVQHSTDISPLWILSVTKKYLMFICLVSFLIDDLPLFSRRIALLFSWYMILSLTPYPWYSLKKLFQRTDGISWSTPKNSYSVELLVLSFWFLDTEIGYPCPIVSPPPVSTLILGFTTFDPSMYHLSIPLLYELRIRDTYLVPLTYSNKCTIFVQSLWSGSLHLVVR